MGELWIGDEDNTSGTYWQTNLCPELYKRHGGYYNAQKLYRFKSKYGVEYNITDKDVLKNLDDLLETESQDSVYQYIYSIIIERFGILDFLSRIDNYIDECKDVAYLDGESSAKHKFREFLGI